MNNKELKKKLKRIFSAKNIQKFVILLVAFSLIATSILPFLV